MEKKPSSRQHCREESSHRMKILLQQNDDAGTSRNEKKDLWMRNKKRKRASGETFFQVVSRKELNSPVLFFQEIEKKRCICDRRQNKQHERKRCMHKESIREIKNEDNA